MAVDPVDGGSANSYDYAMQDPIGNLDLDGRDVFGAVKGAIKTVISVGKKDGTTGEQALGLRHGCVLRIPGCGLEQQR